MNKIVLPLIGFVVLNYACTPSPQKLITKRWKAISARGSESKMNYWGKKLGKTSYEFEFTKDGRFLGYENGTLLTTANYTMASDGKSLSIQNKMGGGYSIEIISLTSGKMEAVTKGFMAPKDTIIYIAQ